jgi:hypothetical protein
VITSVDTPLLTFDFILIMYGQTKWSLEWKRRHVVLANGKLSYFKIQGHHSDSYVLRGEVPINGMTSLIRDRHSHSHPLLKRASSRDHLLRGLICKVEILCSCLMTLGDDWVSDGVWCDVPLRNNRCLQLAHGRPIIESDASI